MIDYLEMLFPQEDEEREERWSLSPIGWRFRGAAREETPLKTEGGSAAGSETDGALTEMARARRRPAGFDGLAAALAPETEETRAEHVRLWAAEQETRQARTAQTETATGGGRQGDTGVTAPGPGIAGGRLVFSDVRGARVRTALAGETLGAMAKGGGGEAAALLYGRVRETAATANYVRRETAQRAAPPTEYQRMEGTTASELDRLCQRDARRYDGAFEFY